MALDLVVPGLFTPPDDWQYIVDPTSIAELSTFTTITVDSGGLDPDEAEARIVLRLEGAGGTLDLFSRIGGAHSVQVDATGITSGGFFATGVVLTATRRNDVINGSAYADDLHGARGNDVLNGGDGNDRLYGGAGVDEMAGGTGDDVFYVENELDTVAEVDNEGYDKVFTSVDFTLGVGQEIEFLRARTTDGLTLGGNEYNNDLIGGVGGDTLNGGDGDDGLYGRVGDDTLNGGDGNDRLYGGEGVDAMAGGDGDDAFYVDDVADTVAEAVGEGYDRVFTSVDFTLGAGEEIELLRVRGTTDGLELTGNERNDYVVGGVGGDVLNGVDGNDRLLGRAGADLLFGGDGNDRLDGGAGQDGMAGGDGDDAYFVDDEFDGVIEAADEGYDTVYTSVSYGLIPDQEVEVLRVRGTADDISLAGNNLANSLIGGKGDDTLSGLEGNDRLNGGAGEDWLAGGEGNDVYYVDELFDSVIEEVGEGIDTVFTNTSYELMSGSEIEELRVKGTTDGVDLLGNEFNNTLIGGVGEDFLEGGAGSDRLFGGDGDDLLVDCDCDFSDTLNGGAGDDILASGGGADILTGGTGGDIFAYDDISYSTHAAFDTITDFAVGEDRLEFTALGTFLPLVTETTAPAMIAANSLVAFVSGGSTILYVNNTDTEQAADSASMEIHLTGVTSLSDADIDIVSPNLPPVITDVSVTETAISFVATDPDSASLALFLTDGIFDPAVNNGAATIVAPVVQDTEVFTFLAVFDGSNLADVAWLYLGTDGNDMGVATDPFLPNAVYGFGGDDTLLGWIGEDWLFGGDGADTITGDAGNDTIVGELADALLDGGDGTDELILKDSGVTLDLTGAAQAAKVTGFEVIDLTGTGDNTLVLDRTAVLAEAEADGDGVHVLTVKRDAGDTVSFTDAQWDNAGTFIDGAVTYDRYVSASGDAEVRIEQGVAASFPTGFDLTDLATSQGFIIQDGGSKVSEAGDVNGDGFADMIVGAGGFDSRGAYVVFGRASDFGTVDGTNRSVFNLLTPADGFVVPGGISGDGFGYSVSSAGDVNGDGFADLIVGAPQFNLDSPNAGKAYVVFGGAPGQGFTIEGVPQSYAGISVSSAGDVNGDGFADVIVGVPRDHTGDITFTGAAYVVFGKAPGFGTVDLSGLSATEGFVIRGPSQDQLAGWSVSSAGDVNGDGFADLIVGSLYANEAYVVFGKASGFGTVDLSSFSATEGFFIEGDVGRSFSSAGDVNGDGFADLIVGSRYGNEASVVFGKDSGFGAAIFLTTLSASDGFIIQGQVGLSSVSSAGDVNGDGFADLIVGAPQGDDGGIQAGEAYVVFGKASGFGTVDGGGRAVIDLAGLSPADGFAIQGDTAGDRAGSSVSSAGDVNGDGFADLIVGAPGGDDGGFNFGEAYVLFGGAFGGSAAPVTNTGTSSAEILIGGLGNDVLSGGGGADSIRGGAGDDVLSVPDLGFRSVDGGGGSDTLVLTGSGQSFDFTALADTRVVGIETIDITGSGDNSVTLGFADVAAMTDGNSFTFPAANSHHALVVNGNAGDSLVLQDYDPDGAGGVDEAIWTLVDADVGLDGSAAGAYDLYDLVRDGSVLASVAMDADMLKV